MNYKLLIAPLILVNFPLTGVLAQNGTADRDEYFRRMELRALELSRKMAELAGTEPIEMIEPRSEETVQFEKSQDVFPTSGNVEAVSAGEAPPLPSVQESYDALPGPAENNKTSTSTKYEDKVGEGSLFFQSTSEEIKGSYFLKPSFVFQAPFDSDVKGIDSLSGKVGNGVGVVVGRRIENWTLSARFGHTHQEFSNSNFAGLSAGGDVETLSLTGNVGISVPLNKKLSFEASFGLGFTSVRHSLSMLVIPVLNETSLDVLSDSGFSYELSLLIDYSFSERLSAFLGYRLAGIPENKGSQLVQFDSVNAHLFELGVGLNF